MAPVSVPIGKALRLADLHRRDGRMAEADSLCRGVLEAEPNSYEAEHLLGLIAYATGRLAEAVEHFRRAADLAPEVAIHHSNLGEVYRLIGRRDEAMAASERALAINPDLPEPWNNLATVAMERGDSQQALDNCRKAIALKPNCVDAYNNLGNILRVTGRLEDARETFLEAIKIKPDGVEAYVNLAEVHKFSVDDPYLAAMEALAESRGLSDAERSHLDFALGSAYRDTKDYGRSFQRYLSGNAGLRARLSYNEKFALALFGHIERVFTPALIATKSGSGSPSALPIFILGMPRSGTTLVEQILASHPQVHGGGELNTLAEAMLTVPGPDGRALSSPAAVAGFSTKELTEIGTRCVEAMHRLAPHAKHVTDKRPNNYYLVGLIHFVLPNAKIIHVVRDPVDTCVSCFTKFFALENQNFDLAELGRYYKRYEHLMAHWQRILPPGRILEVRYESVVADLEGETRRILAHCGLDWDDRCLAFYETQRTVNTASAAQVRQPIYDSSIGRWHHYEEFLGPLLAELSHPGDAVASNG
ncbi:MAG TPA: sulfotransferase [Xanthobacteraceae bacterium]|jgi:Flp pilus assembly protein TadD|nr:sulfotransferase [Xanthobacteraceae bacterium]